MPSRVNYQANFRALKEEEYMYVIVVTACGFLREENQPHDIVIINQFICSTTTRPQFFSDGSHSCGQEMCHISTAEPFCPKTREVLLETAKKLGLQGHSKETRLWETSVRIEGPRFGSQANFFMFWTGGTNVFNMMTVPEVVLAKEDGMSCETIAMTTDHDCWKEPKEAVSVHQVLC